MVRLNSSSHPNEGGFLAHIEQTSLRIEKQQLTLVGVRTAVALWLDLSVRCELENNPRRGGELLLSYMKTCPFDETWKTTSLGMVK